MSEWQPIETAPKDGREIIGYLANGKRRVILWGKTFFPGDYEWCFAHGGLCDQYGSSAPTHWMPLPPPPETTND